jgi:hypothetical protein
MSFVRARRPRRRSGERRWTDDVWALPWVLRTPAPVALVLRAAWRLQVPMSLRAAATVRGRWSAGTVVALTTWITVRQRRLVIGSAPCLRVVTAGGAGPRGAWESMDSLVRPTPLAVRKYARNLQDTEEPAWLCARLSVFGCRVGGGPCGGGATAPGGAGDSGGAGGAGRAAP